ncbi:hypothetical protein V6N13_068829 [Hibiscus sabdariffa]
MATVLSKGGEIWGVEKQREWLSFKQSAQQRWGNMGSGEAKRVALIQAIGTANPPNSYPQDDYPDFCFQFTKSQHLIHLKDKFKRICKYEQYEIRDFVFEY